MRGSGERNRVGASGRNYNLGTTWTVSRPRRDYNIFQKYRQSAERENGRHTFAVRGRTRRSREKSHFAGARAWETGDLFPMENHARPVRTREYAWCRCSSGNGTILSRNKMRADWPTQPHMLSSFLIVYIYLIVTYRCFQLEMCN